MPKKKASQPRLVHNHAATYDAKAEPDALVHLYRPLRKEDLDKVRHIEGFPIGADEDVIALSDPPYYTACPNPFLEDFIRAYGKPYDEATDTYHREPFATDVSEGKNDPIYNAHSYHTKVPHKAIMRYILHYTEPGDVVFDGFCGTGMTGVAAQMCGNPDPEFKAQIEAEMPGVKWGARRAVLCDLSPAATFIAYNYNTPVNVQQFGFEANRILEDIESECGWMYSTQDVTEDREGEINYVVWATVFVCPVCTAEVSLRDLESDSDEDVLQCPKCHSILERDQLSYYTETFFDLASQTTRQRNKKIPVQINYSFDSRRKNKKPDENDLAIIERADDKTSLVWFPTELMLFKGKEWGDTYRRGYHFGYERVGDFYFGRTLQFLSRFHGRCLLLPSDLHHRMLSLLTSVAFAATHLYKYRTKGGGQPAGNNLYIPALIKEQNIVDAIRRKLDDFMAAEARKTVLLKSRVAITTQSSSDLHAIPGNLVDYIFVDPPFGSNIMYSESNFIWEAWLRVYTKRDPEAIVNKTQAKGLPEYQRLMEACFAEFFRILKPSRWITVEFHNSQARVWNSIQEALTRSGFVVADVRTLDKQQKTFKQVTTLGAVKQDLVISAYKPSSGFEQRFLKEAGTEQGAWDFIRQHLSQLPVFVEKNGAVEVIAERQNYLLFDRMVAFHIQRGASVPLSAAEFYAGLRQRFPERDGMYFLPEQVAEYDTKRAQVAQVEQLSLFVSDEKSAVQWLRTQLEAEPQTYQDIQPKFLQELHQARHEKMPELRQLLEENLLKDDQDRWYVPDPAKAEDLEKLRERGLLREFATYVESKGRLKTFRTEAVRAGFKSAWGKRDYATIIEVARRLPEDVLQEDPALLMYYDNAVMRRGG